MLTILVVCPALRQPHVSFVDERSGLQRVVPGLAPQVCLRDAAQFVIDEWNEIIEGLPVAEAQAGKESRDRPERGGRVAIQGALVCLAIWHVWNTSSGMDSGSGIPAISNMIPAKK
jgi:hypothetical protein